MTPHALFAIQTAHSAADTASVKHLFEAYAALFEEFSRAQADVVQPPTRQPWGGTDLHVRDLDGNVISFVTYA